MKRYMIILLLLGSIIFLMASALDDIDRAVESLGSFVTRSIPDRAAQTITVTPFLSDKSGRILLGERLKSELELYLAGNFKNTHIVDQPEGFNNYTLKGEIQVYSEKIRIIVKIIKPDGSLGGGSKIDLQSTPELKALLYTSLGPAGIIFKPGEDPYEPDDLAGYEVMVEEGDVSRFERFLNPGDIDRFRFYIPLQSTVFLETITPLETQLLIYREGETIPFLVYDNEAGSGSLRVETRLEEGYYIVEVLAYDFNIEGAYTLVINLADRAKDEFEPDDSIEEASAIRPGSRQERSLLSGDIDWVELSYRLPGFYTIYTIGSQIDTIISLYLDEYREILSDDDSGELFNSHMGLFLGTRRIFSRISSKDLKDSGSYTLIFEELKPLQIYPNGIVHKFAGQEQPYYLKLRILQSGNYVIMKSGQINPVSIEIYSLPNMIPEESPTGSLFFLSTGDYLITLKGREEETIRLCVAPEAEAGNCERIIKE